MATASIISAVGNLTNYSATVAASAEAMTAVGNVASLTDLWPTQNLGAPPRPLVAGVPTIEKVYHYPFEQGRFLERSIGSALSALQTQKMSLDERILSYINLNKVAMDAQLSHAPRVIKLVADSISFVQQIRVYSEDSQSLLLALQANVQVLLATEQRMLNMIQANLNALMNLLQEICNWGLPALPSLAAQIGNLYYWNGFNFNPVAGFNLQVFSVPDLSFSFNQCSLRSSNFSAFFGTPPATLTDGSVTASQGVLPLPAQGTYGDPTQYATPSYITQMQETTAAPVFDPSQVTTTNGSSLPSPAAIISNYSLPASDYTANIVSAVAVLNPIVIQPDDPDYASGIPATSRLANLRSLLIRYVTLDAIVASNYDPNLVAAWLLYLNLNRSGRGGTWLQNFETQYTASIAPSVAYVQNTPVPWNNVLGGTGVSHAPSAIPLIAALQADTTNNLKWRLSFLEASLLGYPRSRTWEAGADTTFTSSFTGADLDYTPATVTPTPTFSVVLGADTASYPVSATVPQSIASVFNQAVAQAANSILITPSYQTTRPQFMFTYNMLAQATVVDRFTQFWRQWNANLATFLVEDPYVVSFVCEYADVLNSAINPLADPTDFQRVAADAASRNRTWLPGSVLPPIPLATVTTAAETAPTPQTNGWTSGTLDAAAFLSRPDIQAQPLPVQMAMLRTNESFASLKTLQTLVQASVAAAVAEAQLTAASIGMPGWEVESNASQSVAPGVQGTVLSFAQVISDQSHYVQDSSDIEVQSTNPYLLTAVIPWDPAGDRGTRTVNLLQNKVVITTSAIDSTAADPFTSQFSTVLLLHQGDILEVQVAHTCSTAQSVLTGATFLGLQDVGAASGTSASPTPVTPGGSNASSTTVAFTADLPLAALTAVSIQTDGGVLATDPTITTPGVIPFMDGVTLTSASAAGEQVSVAVAYGQAYAVDGANFTIGGLLYVGINGILTQDFTTLTQNVRWVICVGKAITATTFMYEPHIPTNYIQSF